MKDRYQKTVWVDGRTKLDAGKLNNIERGLENLFENALTVSEIYGGDGIRVDIVNEKELLIHTDSGYFMTAEQVLNAIAQAQLGDSEGNIVVDLSGKADRTHTHTINDVEGLREALEAAGISQEALEEYVNSRGFVTSDFVTSAIQAAVPDVSGKANIGDSYTKAQSDEKYQLKGNYLTQHQDISGKANVGDSYTKAQSDEKYQLKGNYQPAGNYLTEHQDISGKANVGDSYTKAQSDARYQLKGEDDGNEIDLSDYLMKSEAASTYQPAGNYLTEHQDISGKANVGDSYTKAQSDEKYQLKGNYLTEHQDISGKADVSHTHSINDITNFPYIPQPGDYLTEENANSLYQQKGSYAEESHTHSTQDISGLQSYVDERILQAQLNGGGNQEIDLSTYLTKSEAASTYQPIGNYLTEHQDLSGYQPAGDYVKTISINSGTKQSIDNTGNIDLSLSSISDSRLTADMIDYLESKLAYTYGYSCSISASPNSISLPSNTTQVTFTATFSVSKSNDSGNKPVSITDVTSSTAGWTKSGNTYTKTATIDPTTTSCSSGSITATVTNSDNKSGTATGSSKSVSFSKPWYVFEDNSGTLSNPAQVVADLLSGTRTNLKTGRSAIDVSNTPVTMTKDYLWFAIPNTRTMVDANNIAGLSALESSTAKYTPSTSLGTYSIYRWGGSLSAGEFLFNLKIN